MTSTTAAPAEKHEPPPPAAADAAARDGVKVVPPPWTLTGDVYCISFWTTAAAAAKGLPKHAYPPLEAASSFANDAGSRHVGGLGMIQIIRYRDSPVGPYDEMFVVPGSFDWSRTRPDGRRERGRNPRMTCAYVSQRHTCYNGRKSESLPPLLPPPPPLRPGPSRAGSTCFARALADGHPAWNCPKHLARFDWDNGADGSVSVKVYPHHTSGDAAESTPGPRPFFQTTFRPVPYLPAFPLATHWANYLGLETTLAQPPLPAGRGSQGELPGTDAWCKLASLQYSPTTRAGWFDLSMRDAHGRLIGEHDNFWPGLGRWQLGYRMENAQLRFDPPLQTWKPAAAAAQPRARL